MKKDVRLVPLRGLLGCWMLLWAFAMGSQPAHAALAPNTLAFQGRALVNGVPFDGTGQFKFALLGLQGTPAVSTVVWSHDGTSSGLNGEPTTSIALSVSKGLYSVRLGDTTIPNMTSTIGVNVVTNVGLRLRVWFNDGANGFQLLSPDQTLTSVAYALAAERSDTARQADTLNTNPSFDGVATFAGSVVMGLIAATDQLNVAGNIRLKNDSSVFGLGGLVGFNDLSLFGDPVAGPDLYIGADGRVGIGTTSLNSRLTVSGPDNNGTSGVLRLESPGQFMVLDGNEIDASSTMTLQFNVPHSLVLVNGGGNVTIGSLPADERLVVQGNIRLSNDSVIKGLDGLVGHNDLRFWGDSNGVEPDFQISSSGSIGHRRVYSNVSFNVRGDAFQGETQHFRVENFFGISILEVQADSDVAVNGDFFVNNGSKDFVIDHPQAPAEKKLRHNTVEGPGYYTFYHGRVRLDGNGEAWVELPSYFEALNTEPQYQLTCIGGYAPVYVAEEVRENRFKISGGKPGLQVSWQVTANRNDPFARDHPYQPEVDKDEDERGNYYYPKGYAASEARAMGRNRQGAGPSADRAK